MTQKLGGLYTQLDNKKQSIPLKHTEVVANIAGNVSRVEVIQTFDNPFTLPLEATYVFPLPDEAAVDEMEIQIGDRLIKGNIKKREEAKQIYQQAKKQGRTAGLLEQERDNIFTTSIANIKPGEQIQVIIRYTDSLKFMGGDYEFIFPMVVGPRFIPGTPIDNSGDTDQVPDASRITPSYTRSAHDINVTVNLDAGVTITKLESPSHQIHIHKEGEIQQITLDKQDTIPNKDLIIRYQVAGKATQTTVLTQADEKGGHFAIYFIPALEYQREEIVPKDVVFLIDTSGSQSGPPLQQCQNLMGHFIDGLNPQDTFSIIDFSNTTQRLSSKPLANNPANRNRAHEYINRLQANGGTYMLNGIQEVLNFPPSTGRLRSIVLLTDGYIGNEDEILAEVQENLPLGNRLYSFGAGDSVNRFLLNRIAEVGKGISHIIRHDESVDKVVADFFRRINNPVLINIQLDWQGSGQPPLIYPQNPPDLFSDQPLVLFGRQADRLNGTLKITANTARNVPFTANFSLDFANQGNPAIAQLWGRARIKQLMEEMYKYETTEKVEQVTETALAYQLVSKYTAFVAVSDDVRVNPEQSLSMEVPVEEPEGLLLRNCYAMPSSLSPMAPPMAGNGNDTITGNDGNDYIDGGNGNDIITGFESFEEAQLMEEMIAPRVNKPQGKNFFKAFRDTANQIFQPPTSTSKISIIKVSGLSEDEKISLSNHLQTLNLPSGYQGTMVIEFEVNQHRVDKILLDEKLSTLSDSKLFRLVRRSLLTWKPDHPITQKITITVEINTY